MVCCDLRTLGEGIVGHPGQTKRRHDYTVIVPVRTRLVEPHNSWHTHDQKIVGRGLCRCLPIDIEMLTSCNIGDVRLGYVWPHQHTNNSGWVLTNFGGEELFNCSERHNLSSAGHEEFLLRAANKREHVTPRTYHLLPHTVTWLQSHTTPYDGDHKQIQVFHLCCIFSLLLL